MNKMNLRPPRKKQSEPLGASRGLCALSLCVVVALAALALARRDAMRGDASVATNRSIAVVANNVDEATEIAVNEDAATLVTTETSEPEPSEDSTVEIAFEPTSQAEPFETATSENTIDESEVRQVALCAAEPTVEIQRSRICDLRIGDRHSSSNPDGTARNIISSRGADPTFL